MGWLAGAPDAAPDLELLERLARSGVVLSATFRRCPDAPPLPPILLAAVPLVQAAHRAIHELGGKIVVGTDAGINVSKPHDVAPHAIHNLMAIGMTPVEALAAMTSGGADALGLPAKGRLVQGADADIIVVDGDPRSDPDAVSRILRVWRSGEPVAR
jgi:imidazolonepropionase-like amidohydrolase